MSVSVRTHLSLVGFLICLTFLGFPGCSKSSSTSSDKTSGPPVAKVNQRTITQDDIDDALGQLPAQARSVYETPEGKKELIDRLVTREVLIQAAEKEGLGNDPSIMSRVRTLREGLLLEAYLRKSVGTKSSISDEEVKAYYDSNPEARRAPDEVRAKHILVKTEEEAEKIKKELKAGKKFEDLAVQYSQDPGSSTRGGDLGVVRRGQTVPEFDKAVFELKSGETSEAVKSPFGYHIIQVYSRTEGKPLSFEQAKDNLRQKLTQDKEKKGFDTLVADLKKAAKIEVY